jgi:hypothetical protein
VLPIVGIAYDMMKINTKNFGLLPSFMPALQAHYVMKMMVLALRARNPARDSNVNVMHRIFACSF